MSAEFTKVVSPNRAGLYTQQVAKFMQRAIPETNSASVQAKIATKILGGKKGADWGITKEDADVITKMPSSMFADFFVDK